MLATKRLVVAAVALPLVLTACAEKDRVVPTDHATPIAVPSVPATVFPKPSSLAPTTEAPTSAPASSAAAITGAPAGGGDTVLAKGTAFAPAKLEVKVGTKVTWNSAPGEFHSVDSGTPDTGADAAGPLKAPVGFTTYSYTFSKAGTFKYFCQPHASLGMAGEIVVS
ncbi:MAG TPA: plastocyanin/azurin family copper-binding protein [Mycobacteriales bacterium]|jgi:plastocyanin